MEQNAIGALILFANCLVFVANLSFSGWYIKYISKELKELKRHYIELHEGWEELLAEVKRREV